jgi:predicted phage terminase large subunit-like protein|tara:strand:+ start:497 stop:2095 length:1599 start_codon:yes stop_codon:yes gene_type:complete
MGEISGTPAKGDRQKDAASELLKREEARDGLIPFIEYTLPAYEAGKHHRHIAEKLEAVARGDLKRLIIQAPPRHGKSQLGTVHFPAWYLGHNPTQQIITASHNADLARGFGRQVRNLCANPLYQNVFEGMGLAADAKAANYWHTSDGGAYLSVGVGGSPTGRGGHLIVIDDPIRGQSDADSKTVRDAMWSWYRSDIYTRRMPEAAIVVIQTRWHDEDLAGQLLSEMESETGDQWDVVDLPALAFADDVLGREEGEALWPEWYPEGVLEETKRVLTASEGPRSWSALYQQRPITEEGAYFKADWLKYYDPRDLNSRFNPHSSRPYLHVYGASDYAVSDSTGDYTVHIVGGVDPNDDLYILDLWKGQVASNVWIDEVIGLMQKYKPLQWAEESGQINKSVGPFLSKRMSELRVYCRREQYSSARDKPTRARSIQARMSMGKVYLPKSAPWLDEFVYELSRFPISGHDDQIDAVSLLGRILDQMSPGLLPAEEQQTHLIPTTYGDLWQRGKNRTRIRNRGAGIVIEPTRIATELQ